MLVDRVDFHHRLTAALEERLDLAAEGARGVLLRAQGERRDREAEESGARNALRLKIERRLITHGQPVEHITRGRLRTVSVGAFIN